MSRQQNKPQGAPAASPPKGQRRPIFLINLERDTKRLQCMKKQLNALRLEFEVVTAVDGYSVPEEERQKMIAGSWQYILPGELGCYLSHRKVWQNMADRNIPEALILEDDVLLNEDFAAVSNSCELPEECRVLQLIGMGIKDYKPVNLNQQLSSRALPLPRGYKMSCYIGRLYCVHAYIIRLSYARQLAPRMLPMKVRTDHLLFDWQHNSYLPWVVYRKDANDKCQFLGKGISISDKRPDNRSYREQTSYHKIRSQYELHRRVFPQGEILPARKKGMLPPSVFVINPERDGPQPSAVAEQLRQWKIPFEIITAKDEKRTSAKILHTAGAVDDRQESQASSAAETDRRLAHIKAYRAALQTEASEAVILEDHIRLNEDFPAWFHGDSTKVNRAPNMIYYSPMWPVRFFSPYLAKPLMHTYEPDSEDATITDAIHKFYTQAYIIRRSQMRKLLKKEYADATVSAILFHKKVRIFHIVRAVIFRKLRSLIQRCILRWPVLLNHGEKLAYWQLEGQDMQLRNLKIILSLCSFSKLYRVKKDD